MLRYQVLLQDYGQSGLWKNRKINIKKKEKGKNMKYTADTKPGMGDPYWYEWSVGQKYIIDMLNPDNEIKHVELQADVALGLDDVVITYMDGHKKFVQVKHTRANDTLTFGDLVTIDTSNVDANSHISLLGELAKSWNEEHSKYSTTDILLFSNRKKGKRIAHAGPQSSIKRPALNWFIDDLSKQLETVKKYNELVFPGYELAWEEWKKQLEYIPNDDKKLEFLKHLSISTDQEELEALGETLIEKLKNTFKTNDEIARLLFATLRVEPGYINFIEKMWDSFHYRAKEWILMIYELLWDYREDFHDNMLTILKKHCEDEDFNVSLYSNLLLENYSSDDSFKYIRNSKSYFDEIPNRGHKLFIKKNRPSPWINGYDCVMEQIELLSERLEVDGEHLEKRVADYCDKIPDTVQLIKLGRKWRGCRVVCENPNRSFLRVLYKDWYNHKFDWEETELGRIVLSASEPYCLLITPQLWTYNNGYLLNPPESFISSSSVEQKEQIHDILFEGVDDTETVLAGGIIDYTHKEEIFGFMVSYFSIPGLPSKYAAHCYERNSRLLLQSRPDFSEQEHYNITLHHNGIESFQGSNIMCGFSKISLDEFHWHINITVNGMRLFNEGGQEIGRFEYYYGQRGNMGNRYISNQPLLQRWVVSKDAISKARCIVGCPNNIKINHAFDSVIRKYED